jgi:hypothetical protein
VLPEQTRPEKHLEGAVFSATRKGDDSEQVPVREEVRGLDDLRVRRCRQQLSDVGDTRHPVWPGAQRRMASSQREVGGWSRLYQVCAAHLELFRRFSRHLPQARKAQSHRHSRLSARAMTGSRFLPAVRHLLKFRDRPLF